MPGKPVAKKPVKSLAKINTSEIQEADVAEMANRMNPNSPYYTHEVDKRPHFAILLGAGASKDSGIPLADEMIDEFIERICAVKCPNLKDKKKKEEWLKNNKHYSSEEDRYAKLFKVCYPRAVDRRDYIESKVDGKTPSLGYIALAHLLENRIIDTIITTNFDDLIYQACTNYINKRPVVYSLGGFASEISATVNRPRVLKLHGDFLFSSLKNTEEELKSQDPNMSQQVKTILETYRGLVVVGYKGNDESIINLIRDLPEDKYLYWCVYKNEEIIEQVADLLKIKNGWIVRHDGFDKLMNEIKEIAGIQDDDIFNLFEEKRKRLRDEVKKFNPQDFQTVRNIYEIFEKANVLVEEMKFAESEKLYRKAIEIKPDFAESYFNLGWLLSKDKKRWKEAEEAYYQVIKLKPDDFQAYNNLGNLLLRTGNYKEAEKFLNKSYALNPKRPRNLLSLAVAHKKAGNTEEFKKYANLAREQISENDLYLTAALHAVLDERDKTLEYLRLAVKENPTVKFYARTDLEFEWLENEPDFKELINE